MARSDARKKLLDQLPSVEEMTGTIASLRLLDDAAMVLMGAAYLDHALEVLLRSEFRELSTDDDKRMFDGSQNGILGTFSSKIRMAYAIGWLIPEVYHDLLLINDIRNVFAHSLHPNLYFTNPLIDGDIKKLQSLKHLGELKYNARDTDYHPLGVYLFVDTVQYTYATLKAIADNKTNVMESHRHTLDLALQQERESAADAFSPLPRRPPSPPRRNRPKQKKP